jgi:hypothetical protein
MTTTMDSAIAVSKTRLSLIIETALTSSLNCHVVCEQRHWNRGWLTTRMGQNTLVENHIINGGVGPLTPGQEAYLKRIAC